VRKCKFESRSLFTYPDQTGWTFVVGVSAGALTWDRPILVRGLFLSTSFVGNQASVDPATDAALMRGEVIAARTSGDRQDFDASTDNIIIGATVLGGTALQRSMDGILLSQAFAYAAPGVSFSKSSGVTWEPEEAWELNVNQAITCFMSGDFGTDVFHSIMTVHFNYAD
jgi:hypothetical protein